MKSIFLDEVVFKCLFEHVRLWIPVAIGDEVDNHDKDAVAGQLTDDVP